jgi:hypothetical protein
MFSTALSRSNNRAASTFRQMNRDQIINNQIITNTNKIPVCLDLANIGDIPGMVGDIILQLSNRSFYGHNGITWTLLNGGGGGGSNLQGTYDISTPAKIILGAIPTGPIQFINDVSNSMSELFSVGSNNGLGVISSRQLAVYKNNIIGLNAQIPITGTNCFIFGDNASGNFNDTIVIGTNSSAGANFAITIGAQIQNDNLDSIAIW